MNATTYREMSKTAEGRKELHTIMLQEVQARIDSLVESAPEANRAMLSDMMKAAVDKIAALGNGEMYTFFADEKVSTSDFISYLNDIIKGNL